MTRALDGNTRILRAVREQQGQTGRTEIRISRVGRYHHSPLNNSLFLFLAQNPEEKREGVRRVRRLRSGPVRLSLTLLGFHLKSGAERRSCEHIGGWKHAERSAKRRRCSSRRSPALHLPQRGATVAPRSHGAAEPPHNSSSLRWTSPGAGAGAEHRQCGLPESETRPSPSNSPSLCSSPRIPSRAEPSRTCLRCVELSPPLILHSCLD